MGNADTSNDSDERDKPATPQAGSGQFLKPKGACWYCNSPVDNVRRFCNKTCADDYRLEDESFNPAA